MRVALGAVLAVATIASIDAKLVSRASNAPDTADTLLPPPSACEGARADLPDTLPFSLRAGAFPGSDRPDVAVHVPPGFNARRRPGLIVYFHGWQGCVAATFMADATACSDAGPPRTGSDLAAQLDAAGANALLVSVELRADMATGEPGAIAMPGGLRGLLRELLTEHLRDTLGCSLDRDALDLDALDRVVVVAHSGGYQAAAGAIELGDVPRITEVDLLDALYGADDVFLRWLRTQRERFDPRVNDGLRFVDLYTCCGGTADASRSLAESAAAILQGAGLGAKVGFDDSETALDRALLMTHPVVFKRVPGPHGELPRAYLRELIEAAGFAHIEWYGSHSLRPK
jgi:hypothetical protein